MRRGSSIRSLTPPSRLTKRLNGLRTYANHQDDGLWHELPVRGAAAIPSGYRGTYPVPVARPTGLHLTPKPSSRSAHVETFSA